MAPPFREAEFDIIYGEGISREGDILDLAVENQIIEKSGTWYSYGEDRIGQGRESAKKFLKESPELLEKAANELHAKFGLNTAMDKEPKEDSSKD